MKWLWILVLVLATACNSAASGGNHGHEHSADPGDERPALSFTHWTDSSELFMELRALVKGQESPCAAHITKLSGFSALGEGQVHVILRSESGDERFESSTPSRPGIFRPVAKPASSGKRRLLVEVRAPGLSADHDLGEVTVFDSVAAARAAIPEESEAPGRISFLKEQQWPIDFGTSVVTERIIRPSLRAMGHLRARSDGDVLVKAPSAGRVLLSGKTFPHLGDQVRADDPLLALTPRLDAADLASLELSLNSAAIELRFAEREKQRLETLRNEGAVPEGRVTIAAHAVEEASAALSAAKKRLAQFRGAQQRAGVTGSTVQIRAPLSGHVTEVMAGAGSFVEAGESLVRITHLDPLWLEVRVPESDSARLAQIQGASVYLEGRAEPLELKAEDLVARGHIIDPQSRTFPLIFALPNPGAQMPIGTFARVFLLNGEERRNLAVPESALVDDGGVFVVFVQREGESFERRIVRLGVRDRGYVEVQSGLEAGEHIVIQGAWSLKLAASSGAVPAHGHSH